VDVCPESCIRLVAVDRIEFGGVGERLGVDRGVFGVELGDMAPGELGRGVGTALLKNETRCIRCGLCAERCPVNVITMEAFSIKGQEVLAGA
jgi:NAD-dependent dihydropyrimidine dehydrogenase PreA subunit